MTDSATRTDDIFITRSGSAAVIHLNRPKALNSLTLSMVEVLKPALDNLASADDVSCVILTGEGERGLCAGGDIRAIHDAGKAAFESAEDPARFWREEFPVNYMISRYPKPYVALMDGIVMGGGVGLSAHGRHRIVTERTRLAMPETGIGYVPDVGVTWLLANAPGEVGTWIGLTGEIVGAADAIFAGLADYHLPSARLGDVVAALAGLRAGVSDAEIAGVIDAFSTRRDSGRPDDGRLEANRNIIDRVFRHDTVEEIVAALETEEGAFAGETLSLISKRSPTSLKLTLRLLRAARESSGLIECLEREFTVASAILRNHDFYEGVRAAVIDKDRNPKWLPSRLDEVKAADLDRYFEGHHKALFADHRI